MKGWAIVYGGWIRRREISPALRPILAAGIADFSLITRFGTADLGVKMEKNSGVIKGRFYMTTSLGDSWEAFTPLHAGVTLGRFLH